MDVVLVRWPSDDATRAALSAGRRARLLLVEGSADPPSVEDELEDWIRVPADEIDLHARMATLHHRATAKATFVPDIDEHGVLRVNGSWVPLPPVEARLVSALLARYRAVVSRDALGRAGWPDGAPGRNALDVHVLRLRRRLAPLSLAIRTVRSRGYLLERTDDAPRR